MAISFKVGKMIEPNGKKLKRKSIMVKNIINGLKHLI